jgi:hypothetical protein
MRKQGTATKVLEWVFFQRYTAGNVEVSFDTGDIDQAYAALGLKPLGNPADIRYRFRSRGLLPQTIADTAPDGMRWLLRGRGKGKYCFALTKQPPIRPNEVMLKIKIPDATPGIISRYAFNDEQALLAKLRYNRLVDIFTGIVCYSLQNHLRTYVKGVGQIETDELYVGVDQNGDHHVLPVQAKGKHERIEIVQIEQDFALGKEKFADLNCRPIGAQFMDDDVIALFEFVIDGETVSVRQEKHYRLVPPDQISITDLESYRTALPG